MNDMTPSVQPPERRFGLPEAALREIADLVEWTFGPGESGLTAYVASQTDAAFALAREKVRDMVDSVVRVSRLPRDEAGSIDLSALSRQQDCEPPAEAAAGPPAILDGGPLADPPASPRTLGEALRLAAREAADRGVTFVDERGDTAFLSYAELYAEASACAQALRRWRQEGYQHAIICSDDRRAFLRAFWGCQLTGLVPVPCELPIGKTETPRRGLDSILATLGPTLVLLGAKEMAIADGFGGAAIALPIPEGGDGAADFEPFEARPDDLALLLSTSGSTGSAKLVMQTHDRLLAYCKGSIERFAMGADMVSLNWFPLTHVGGLVMYHLRDVVARCRQIQAATDFVLRRPLAWLELIERFAVTNSWAPNFAYALVTEELRKRPDSHFDLSSLRILLNGGELIVARQASAFLAATARFGIGAEVMLPAWGMSETCSGVLYGPREIPEDGPVAVGTPFPGCAVRITDGAGTLKVVGEAGELEVRGQSVLSGYFRNPEANRASFTEDGWFRTGDLARIGEDGVIIQGRSKDTLIINGLNVPATDLEQVADSVEGVETSFSAAVPIRGAGDSTDKVLLLIVPNEGADPEQVCASVTEAVHAATGIRPAWVRAVRREDIPKTAIGKIQRQQIQRLWSERLGGAAISSPLAVHSLRSHRFVPDSPPPGRSAPLVVVAGVPPAGLDGMSEAKIVDRRGLAQALAAAPEGAVDVALVVRPRALASEAARDVLTAIWELVPPLAERAARGGVRLTLLPWGTGAADRLWMEPAEALVRCLGTELRGLRTRTIRTTEARPDWQAAVSAAFTAHDLTLDGDGFTTWRLHSEAPQATATESREAGLYVVTGGLGAIGHRLCEHLIETRGARLLIVGRVPLEEARAEHKERLQALRARTDVTYLPWQGEAATADALRGSMAGTAPAGIFHLSGSLAYGAPDEGFPSRLGQAWESKAEVANSLVRIAGEHPSCPLVFFSSLASRFGGVGVSAHGAANAYLDGLCELLNQQERGRAYSLLWSVWAGVGQSVGKTDPEAARRSGFEPIEVEAGLAAMDSVLAGQPGCYLIGLRTQVPAVAWLAEDVAVIESPREQEAAPAPAAPRPEAAPARALDLKAAMRGSTTVEADLVGIWRSLLALDRFDRNDSFFDLGGNSLHVPQVQEAVASRFGVELKPVDVFRYPTVATLSAHIASLSAG
jgi:acyl-CoA synthetase (AMP-forming)/AMP-acid ligase II/NAD(P)-dependent dehydrogenase (short-subunit alcohol dehydrogenase family)/acyl carrier protein